MRHKSQFDFAETAGRLAPYNMAILESELPGGKREGGEYVALNPTRADQRAGSFKVNLTSGRWCDFATGDKGGDIISLTAYLRKCNQKEAATALVEQYLGDPILRGERERAKSARQAEDEDERSRWEPVVPAPDDAPELPKAHYHYGVWTKMWTYRDGDGDLLGHICRFDRHGKGKEILPLICCRHAQTGRVDWRWRSFPSPRPLYGLDRLVEKPDAPVLVVEGEKCADAGADALPDMAVVSWPGGSKAVGKALWAPLFGRSVYLWPDRDRVGYLAMMDVAERLGIGETTAYIVRPPDGKPKGWDIADAIAEGWSTEELRDHIETSRMTVDECQRAHESQRDEKRTVSVDGSGNGGGNGDGGSEAGDDEYIPQFHFTDTGNAQRLVRSFGSMIRYNDDPFKKWFIWDGSRWCEDRVNRIYYYVDRVVADIYREAAEASDKDNRHDLMKWAFKLEDMRRQNTMVAKAQTMQNIVITADNLDRDVYLLNLENCTLDLSSGKPVKREHRQADYITKIAPVSFDDSARAPRWEKFLEEIFPDEALRGFIRRAVGYSLTGDVSAQCFFFAYGTGMNGKSVFFNLLQMLLGDYWGKAPTDMIMQQQYSQVPTDVADLRGLRFVVCSELADNRRFSEDRIKDLTGEDQIKARRMRENFFDFRPTHKLWMYGNHKPQIQGTDPGIWRRVRIIPFTVRIPDEQRMPMRTILDGFREELPGILNWALAGFVEYMERGLGEPDVVLSATDEYRQEMDIVGRFIDENCMVNPSVQVQSMKMWRAYHGWCDDVGEHAMTGRRLNQRLREMGYEVKAGHGNKSFVYGVTLNQEAEDSFLKS